MARVSRARSKALAFPPGTARGSYGGTSWFDSNASGLSRMIYTTCSDQVGRPVAPSPLTIATFDRSTLIPINGSWGTEGVGDWGTVENYISYGLRENSFGHNATSMPSAGSRMSTLLARTNPSRPDYVPLSILQDLIDIPRQLRDVGKLIRTPKRLLTAKEIANQNLGWQFGWKPLFEDVASLFDLQAHIHKRVGELHRLYSAGGLKRRIHLGRWNGTGSGHWSVSTVWRIADQDVNFETFTEADSWGTVRWLPNTLPGYNPNDAEIIRQARDVVLGLSLEATLKGAWDLIPWTWVVDWFTNIGDFALQYSNTVPARPSEACVMTRTLTKLELTRYAVSHGLPGGGGYMTYLTKERYVGGATLDVHLPFISANRLSILGSLFVQRFKR